MLLPVIRKGLQLAGRVNLIPFFDSILAHGRRREVDPPVELLEQGVWVLLSGANNSVAMHASSHWVWPYWMQRQCDPRLSSFVPSGAQLLTVNITHRNWTTLSIPGTKFSALVDPAGMITPQQQWSIVPFVRHLGKTYTSLGNVDSLAQSWAENHALVTSLRIDQVADLSWICRCYTVRNTPVIEITMEVHSAKTTPEEFFIGFAIRPYNPTGIGHIFSASCKDHLVLVNNKPALRLLEKPDRVMSADRHARDPLNNTKESNRTEISSRTGISSITVEWKVSLDSGGRASRSCFASLNAGAADYSLSDLHGDEIAESQLKVARQLALVQTQDARLPCPDENIARCLARLQQRLHVFDVGTHFTPGAMQYQTHWLRDTAFLALAFLNLGRFAEVHRKVETILATQRRNGLFCTQNGEWDGVGQALFTLVRYGFMADDLETMRQIFPQLLAGCQWIEDARLRTKHPRGLLPAGLSAEHFGPDDTFFWDNDWALAGIRSVASLAVEIGEPSTAQLLVQRANDYQEALTGVQQNVFHRLGRTILPVSPHRRMDSAAVGNLAGITPLNTTDPFAAWVAPTLDYLQNYCTHKGLLFHSVAHTGLNIYLSLQLAKGWQHRGDIRWLPILREVTHAATSTGAWPEAIHPCTGGGCMGDGDHGWAAAEYINIVRDAVLWDGASRILIAHGITEDWFIAQEEVTLGRAPCTAGILDFALELTPSQWRARWVLKRYRRNQPLPLFLSLPGETLAVPQNTPHWQPHGSRWLIPLAEDSGEISLMRSQP